MGGWLSSPRTTTPSNELTGSKHYQIRLASWILQKKTGKRALSHATIKTFLENSIQLVLFGSRQLDKDQMAAYCIDVAPSGSGKSDAINVLALLASQQSQPVTLLVPTNADVKPRVTDLALLRQISTTCMDDTQDPGVIQVVSWQRMRESKMAFADILVRNETLLLCDDLTESVHGTSFQRMSAADVRAVLLDEGLFKLVRVCAIRST